MSIRMFTLATITMATASSFALAHDGHDHGIELSNPAVRAMPPSSPMSGAYVTLYNHSDHERFLVGAESDVANRVEVHISEMDGETMIMRHVDQVAIPANGQTVMKPGGYHIMLMGLKRPLKAGDQVDFTLIMKNGEQFPMQAPVLSPDEMASYMPAGAPNMDHSKMNHGDMAMDGGKKHQ